MRNKTIPKRITIAISRESYSRLLERKRGNDNFTDVLNKMFTEIDTLKEVNKELRDRMNEIEQAAFACIEEK